MDLTTQNEAQESAAQKAGNLPELLNIILEYLDYPDLLLMQRVCERWLNCISETHNLQPLLFRKPQMIVPRPRIRRHPSADQLADVLFQKINPHFEGPRLQWIPLER
ncbi:hypothetical protein DM02DRAFT_655271 [Periconia macrospinosa]|uniref:F-box domain-containing protein n=1 Tax=Periconia macrospinosa TaxID=97972 RepID=A0A2V1DRY1_9PLEO|nr:hypothetical protein DM02DRAFT_655271 [Periconia macrospinosa]